MVRTAIAASMVFWLCVQHVLAQESSARLWALGAYWDIRDIEWVSFQDHFEIRAVVHGAQWDGRSEAPEALSDTVVLNALCATLLAHRPVPPSADLGRTDVFRVSLASGQTNDSERRIAAAHVPISVVDGACTVISNAGPSALTYQGGLDGWAFLGFAELDDLEELQPWGAEAYPIFSQPEGLDEPPPLELLCDAAVFEARYWRELGRFRDGARIAIGVATAAGEADFFLAVRSIELGQCVFPEPGGFGNL